MQRQTIYCTGCNGLRHCVAVFVYSGRYVELYCAGCAERATELPPTPSSAWLPIEEFWERVDARIVLNAIEVHSQPYGAQALRKERYCRNHGVPAVCVAVGPGNQTYWACNGCSNDPRVLTKFTTDVWWAMTDVRGEWGGA